MGDDKHHVQYEKARYRMQKAYEEVKKSSLKHSLGEISDEQLSVFLLEHYKAQMEMAEFVAYWPMTPIIYGEKVDVMEVLDE